MPNTSSRMLHGHRVSKPYGVGEIQPVTICGAHQTGSMLDASLESHPEYLPSQALTSELPLGQELEVMKQTLEPLDSTLPRSVLAPEATVVNLEDMPPLPPLPPMQWRMGIQHASPFFTERIGWSWLGFFAANTAIGIS
ncbi:hypothetical protein COP2_010164 [Malus domestica]